jgi:hypothetical protein
MHYSLLFVSFFSLFIIGFISLWRISSKNEERRNFTDEYREEFIKFCNNYMQTSQAGSEYVWLLQNSTVIQRQMGSFGVMTFKPPFANYQYTNYPVLINTIPKFRDGSIHQAEIGFVDDSLLRYLKRLDDVVSAANKNLHNPIIWFRQGIRTVLGIPFYLLDWFGLVSPIATERLIANSFFKFISNLSAFVAFISGLITIAVGWDQALVFIKKLLH